MNNLWVAVSGANALQRKVDTIANNVANSNTAGFKKDQLAFREHLVALDNGTSDINMPNKEWAPEDFYHSNGAEDSFVEVAGTYTIHDQGQLNPTGNPYDFALNGEGFFEILTPGGIRFTRRGNFSVNRDGLLVTSNGHPVLQKANLAEQAEFPKPQDRVIKVGNGNLTSNFEGQLFNDGTKVGELSIVEFNDVHAIRKEDASMFVNNQPENIKNSINTAVNQKFIEGSNVNALEEMSSLIRANRQFETIQRAIKAYDNVTGKGINEIAKN